MTKAKKSKDQIQEMPGHLFRRLHQIAVAKFALETDAHKITPVQWAILQATHDNPGLDQSTLARQIASIALCLLKNNDKYNENYREYLKERKKLQKEFFESTL
jgi:hypothetical protein